jgi:hypothetical protein
MTQPSGNHLLGDWFELCRAAVMVAKARVALWETWLDGELEAQTRGRE